MISLNASPQLLLFCLNPITCAIAVGSTLLVNKYGSDKLKGDWGNVFNNTYVNRAYVLAAQSIIGMGYMIADPIGMIKDLIEFNEMFMKDPYGTLRAIAYAQKEAFEKDPFEASINALVIIGKV